MPKNKPIYCWDTSIFTAWIKNEQRPSGEMEGVAEIAEKVQGNKAILIASQMLNVELLECKLPTGAMEKIQRFFKRKNAQLRPMDGRISTLAGSLRNAHAKLTSPDAIHLATAIYYEADEFHTFDDGKKGGISLLDLSGNVGGHPLVICKPVFTQYRLPGF